MFYLIAVLGLSQITSSVAVATVTGNSGSPIAVGVTGTTTPTPVTGFTCAIAGSTTRLTGIVPGPVLSGNAALFFQTAIEPDHVRVACVFALPPDASGSLVLNDTTLFTLNYLVPACSAEAVVLSPSSAFGIEVLYSRLPGLAPIVPDLVPGGYNSIVNDHAFQRGNVNRGSPNVNISDAIDLLHFLFFGFIPSFDCAGALDANNDGVYDISDPVRILTSLIGITGALPAPNSPMVTVPDGGSVPSALGCAQGEVCF